jgi:hypothetical protein
MENSDGKRTMEDSIEISKKRGRASESTVDERAPVHVSV